MEKNIQQNDLTDKIKGEVRLEIFRRGFEGSPNSQVIAEYRNQDVHILQVNKAFTEYYGYSKEEVIGENPRILNSNKMSLDFFKRMWKAILDPKIGFWRGEIINKRKVGKLINVILTINTIFDEKEKPRYFTAYHIDITDRKNAEEKLKESELENIVNKSPSIAFLWKNKEGWPVEYVSKNIIQFGYTPEEFYSGELPYSKIIHPDDLERVATEVNLHSMENVQEFEQDYRIITKNGVVYWINDHTWIRRNQKGAITHYQGIILDITKRKELQEELKESEKQYRTIIESIGDPIHVIDSEFQIILLNPAIEDWMRKLGMETDVVGRNLFDVFPFLSKKVINEYQQAFETGKTIVTEEFTIFNDVSIFTETRKIPIFSGDHVIQVLTIIGDVTKAKLNEKKLKESEEKYKNERDNLINILDSMEDGVYIVNQQYDIEYVNPILIKEFGLPESKICYEYFHDQIEVCPWCKNKEVFAGNTVRWEWYSFKNQKTYELIDTPLKNPDGSISKLEIFRDITDRKIAEQKLKESEASYKNLSNEMEMILDHIPALVFYKNTQNQILRVNKLVADAYNLSKEELIGKSLFDLYPEEEAQAYWDDDFEVIKSGTPKLNFEEPWDTVEGKKWVSTSKIPYFDEDGDIKGIIGFSRDITECKEAEQKLKESEANLIESNNLLNSILDNTPILFAYLDPQFNFIRVNCAYAEADDREISFFPGKNHFDLYPNAENERKFRGVVETGEQLFTFAKSFKYIEHPERGISYWDWSLIPIKDSKGMVASLVLSLQNVTERIEAEQKLKESEEKYKNERDNLINILDSMEDGVYIVNQQYDIEYVNPILTEEFGLPESKKCYEYFHDRIEICPWCKNKEVFAGNPVRWEWYSFKNQKTYDLIDTPLKNPDGSILKLEIFRDITEHKLAEEKLAKSEEKYRKAFNQANFYKDLFAHDINNILQNINSSEELLTLFLNNPEKSNERENLLEIIKRQVKRGQTLVSNVQKLSQLEEIGISIKKIDVNDVLDKAVNYMYKSFPDREIDIDVDVPDKQFVVHANELLLDVFENILNNAIKHTDNPSIEIIVKVSNLLLDEVDYVRLEFIDNGRGIPDAMKEVIFQEGYKKDITTKGMGIGLSLVKKILEQYNGQIQVVDRVKGDYSKGSNFIILIPEA